MAIPRARERLLLLYVFFILILGMASLVLATEKQPDWAPLAYASVFGLLLWVVHIFLIKWAKTTDQFIFPVTALMASVGLIVLFRLKPALAIKQFYWLVLSIGVFLATVRLLRNYRKLEEYTYVYLVVSILGLAVTIFFGITVGGATSWINFGAFRFQPSELVKLFFVAFVSSFLVEQKDLLATGTRTWLGINIPALPHFAPLVGMWGISLLLLVAQKDLGAALLFFGTFLAMLYMATGRKLYLGVGMILFAIGGTVAYYLFGHVQIRVVTWLDPWPMIDGKGYQIIQSLFALGSGGLLGTGLGMGHPSFIPAVHTDFIFSAIGEEMGLFGAVAIILLYIFFLYRGLKIALQARSEFGNILAAGLTILFSIQTLVILSGVTKLLPLTGITLPFISYGGSSLLMNFILLGLLLNISRKDGENI